MTLGQKLLYKITVKLNLIQLIKTNLVEKFKRRKTNEIRKEHLDELWKLGEMSQNQYSKENTRSFISNTFVSNTRLK